MFKNLQTKLASGSFMEMKALSDSLKSSCRHDPELMRKADSLVEIAGRTAIDFSVPEDQEMKQIEKRMGVFSPEMMKTWENRGWIESRVINGRKMYFKRAASNLLLLKKFYDQKKEWADELANDPNMIFRRKHTGEVIKESASGNNTVVPVNMKITYTITVDPDAVPDGELIRCWIPIPKENHQRQKKFELLNTSPSKYIIAPDSAIHRSIYMEETSKKGVPAVFQVSYTYQSNAQHFDMNTIKPRPYDKISMNYKKYTSEQPPQICFTDNVKHLADSLTGKEDDPATVVRKIYSWFKENIVWTGALEYSIMPNIPEYVYYNKRGDCGMQTFLFMSMLRYKGIPVRWQSGWMVPPGDKNLHDWSEVYYEGTGWIPVDISYDLQHSEVPVIKEFYLSGLDSYRLIVNDDISGQFYPPKKYIRSEPYDFQRGEVESSSKNLYFDKWDYDMKIEYSGNK
jgi:Transglutaminase-like superfamily